MTKLMERRKAFGCTRDQLAMMTGIPIRTLEALEQGRRRFTGLKIDKALLICEALNCKCEDLID